MITQENTLVENPDYLEARYEYRVRNPNGTFCTVHWPVRGNELVDGKIVPIPAFVTLAEAIEIKRRRKSH